jgi:hypothetical protein
MTLEKEEEANGDQIKSNQRSREANGVHIAEVEVLGIVRSGEFADAVQCGLRGVVVGVDDDDAEAL